MQSEYFLEWNLVISYRDDFTCRFQIYITLKSTYYALLSILFKFIFFKLIVSICLFVTLEDLR